VGTKIFKTLLAILLLTALTAPWLAVIVAAKPLGPDPGWVHWPAGTIWGARLVLENNASGDVFFGATTGAEHTFLAAPTPPQAPYIWEVLRQGTTDYGEITRTEPAAPQSYTWYVKMYYKSDLGDNVDAKIWTVLENEDSLFIPQDYSVILENQAKSIGPWNLRKENGSINLVDGAAIKYATLYVDNAVNVTISPSYQENKVGGTLTYSVTVKNTGRYADNYVLENSDQFGWKLSLDNKLLKVPAGENRTTTLHVSIDNCASDAVTVTANGVYASDSDSAIATVPPHSVELTVEPPSQENVNGGTLAYTVVVNNVGSLSDNYDLKVIDNLGWGDNIYLDNVKLENIGPSENKQTTLHVYVPYGVKGCTGDNITVTATSQAANTVSDNASCIAHVAIARSVEVSITPGYDNGVPSTVLDYTVTLTNTGNVDDNYKLSWSDNTGWGDNIWLDDNVLWIGKFWGENSTTLHVHVPYCVKAFTEDNITVVATSQENGSINDNASCIAHVDLLRSVEVSISPEYRENFHGGTLNYTVTVTNAGNVTDNYDLSVTDNTGWNPSVFDNLLENVPLCENIQVMLSVVIPENAKVCTEDNIVVKATSRTDPTVSDNASCIAHAVEKFALGLGSGWNLVSFPLTLEGMTPANLFAGQTYYTWRWDAENKKYISPSPTTPVELGVGYWIWVGYGQTVTTIGVPVENYSINLIAGWNLVGFPATNENTTPDNLFSGQTYYIWKWDAVHAKYVSPSATAPVELGVSYWVWVDHNQMIAVPIE
jgi:uncharacterized membrane protein